MASLLGSGSAGLGTGKELFPDVRGKHPGSHPVYDDPLRVVVLRKSPYFVLYRDLPDEVEVAAIAHGHRKPGYWKDRLDS